MKTVPNKYLDETLIAPKRSMNLLSYVKTIIVTLDKCQNVHNIIFHVINWLEHVHMLAHHQ